MIGRAVSQLEFRTVRIYETWFSSLRKGRPQFGESISDLVSAPAEKMSEDKEGVAIIMCESGLESKYRTLGHGQTTLESSLHSNLAEHINSEVGLGTIINIATAKEWMRNSFMFRRLLQNPQRYLSKEQNWEDGLDSMLMKCINDLKDAELLTYVEGRSGELRSTEFGDIMSKVCMSELNCTTYAH
jgi:replicative superfamily II helicase